MRRYAKGALNGVKSWEAPPSTFPGADGRGGDRAIGEVANATGWSIVAHTRFFAADTGNIMPVLDCFSSKRT